MPSLKDIMVQARGGRLVLQGNMAFALGVLDAGYHAADGYPGTPSTEVMEALLDVPDRIVAGWSVNEAVAVGVAMGHAVAGRDALATMKLPGLFQAADVVVSAASSTAFSGALVLYVATDHEPSSTQYLVDSRHFLSSIKVPVLEPRDHQDLYRSARVAADLSRRFSTPVVVLCSSVLCHCEGIVAPEAPRTVEFAPCHAAQGHVLLPLDALRAHRHAVSVRIPSLASWAEEGALCEQSGATQAPGIVATGEAAMIVREALGLLGIAPPLLSVGITHPLPIERIRRFARRFGGKIHLFEDGGRFVEDSLRAAGIAVVGKEVDPSIANWTPDLVVRFLSEDPGPLAAEAFAIEGPTPPRRPPSICPGCPFRAVSLAIQALRKRGRLDLVFGDIGCSTLLHFQGALDLSLCMGASESMRQGYVLSNPAAAGRVISLIGDSSECHSGMDATRNASYRRIPGVKVVLDNRAIAMTGAQPSPTSKGETSLDLVRALEAEGALTTQVDAYDRRAVERALGAALRQAENGVFAAVVLKGCCLEVSDRGSKVDTVLGVDAERCLRCGSCGVCVGIDAKPGAFPRFTAQCTRCGEGTELCMAACPSKAISAVPKPGLAKVEPPSETVAYGSAEGPANPSILPDSLRVAVCGVGGQGNLFFGKVLSQVVRTTAYFERNIVKGDVHGMAQKGGTVCSTFACGDVHSPLFASGSADILVAMERGELLRPEFLRLLKEDGTILLSDAAFPPPGLSTPYPSLESILEATKAFRTVLVKSGDTPLRNANAAMLGALSVQAPFDAIGVDVWLDALRRLSPTPAISQGNTQAFEAGRHNALSHTTAFATLDVPRRTP